MSLLQSIADKLALRRVTEQSLVSVGHGDSTANISDIFDQMLADKNIEPLAVISQDEHGVLALMRSMAVRRPADDLEGFLDDFVNAYLVFSVAKKGFRSEQLCRIAGGYFGIQADIEVARARKGKSDLEDRGLI